MAHWYFRERRRRNEEKFRGGENCAQCKVVDFVSGEDILISIRYRILKLRGRFRLYYYSIRYYQRDDIKLIMMILFADIRMHKLIPFASFDIV